jgi:prophage antirepressor-like protein
MKVENWNGHGIRFVDKDGEWWAVAQDVCAVLDIENARQALQNIPERFKGVSTIYTLSIAKDGRGGGRQRVSIVHEFGIYKLIFTSRKAEAEAFQIWVFGIIKELRKSLGLSEYEAFRLMDKEHQKAAMRKLGESLREPVKVNYIKANTIADKAVSTMHGFTKMVKKADMDEGMLRDREPVLADTVELMAVNERLELGLSVSEAVYRKYCTLSAQMFRLYRSVCLCGKIYHTCIKKQGVSAYF